MNTLTNARGIGFHIKRDEDSVPIEIIWSSQLPHVSAEIVKQYRRGGVPCSVVVERMIDPPTDSKMKIKKASGTHTKEELSAMSREYLEGGGKVTKCIPAKAGGINYNRMKNKEIAEARKKWAVKHYTTVSDGIADEPDWPVGSVQGYYP